MVVELIHDQQGTFNYVFNRGLVIDRLQNNLKVDVFEVESDTWLSEFILQGIEETSNSDSDFLLDPKIRKQNDFESRESAKSNKLFKEGDTESVEGEKLFKKKVMESNNGEKFLKEGESSVSYAQVNASSYRQVMGELDQAYLTNYREKSTNKFTKAKRELILKALDIQPQDHIVFFRTNQTDHEYQLMGLNLPASNPDATFLKNTLNPELSEQDLIRLGVITWDPEHNAQVQKKKEELIQAQKEGKEVVTESCIPFSISKIYIRPDDFAVSLDMQISGPFSIVTFGQRDCSDYSRPPPTFLFGQMLWDFALVLVNTLTKLTFLSIFNFKDLYDLIQLDEIPKDSVLSKVMHFFNVFECNAGFMVIIQTKELENKKNIQTKLYDMFGNKFVLDTKTK